MAVGKQSHFRERLGKEKPLMAGRGREGELHPRETWFELSWRERKCLSGGKKKRRREYVLAKQRANSLRHLRQKGKYAVLRVLDYGLSLFHPALRLFLFSFSSSNTATVRYDLPHMDNAAHLLMSHIYFSLITVDSTPNMHLSSAPKISPLVWLGAILVFAKRNPQRRILRDGRN